MIICWWNCFMLGVCRIGCNFFCFNRKFCSKGLFVFWKLESMCSFLMVFSGRFCVLFINNSVWWFCVLRVNKKFFRFFKIFVLVLLVILILNFVVIILINLLGDNFGVIIWVVMMLFLILVNKLFVMVVFLVLMLLVIMINFLVCDNLYCR